MSRQARVAVALHPAASSRTAHRRIVGATVAVVCWACAAFGQAPLVDAVDLEGFEPTIARQIHEAAASASATPGAEHVGRLGVLLHAYDRFDAAIRCYRRARVLDPRAFDWIYYEAVAHSQAGDLEEAASVFEQALALRPHDVPTRTRLAAVWFELGRFDDSGRLYREVIRDAPASATAQYGLGRLLAARGDPAAAVMQYERAIALAPDYGAAHYGVAMAYRERGDTERASAALVRFEATRGHAPDDDPLMAFLGAQRLGPYEDLAAGRALLQSGRPADAVDVLERAVLARPDLVQAHVNLIAAYGGVGALEKAERAYAQAVALSPALPEAHYNAGVLWLSHGDHERARAALERAVAASPSHADARNNLGVLLMRAGRLDDGEAHFRAALSVQPRHRDAHFNLARLLRERGRSAEALVHFTRATEQEDDRTALYLYHLADAHARLGQVDEALRYGRAARDRASAHGQADLVARIEQDLQRLQELSGRR